MDNITDTGLRFKGHPILLGPSPITNQTADRLTLTRLDRFLRKHFPFLLGFRQTKEILVMGAVPPKEGSNGS